MPLPDERLFLRKFLSAVTEDEELMRAYFARFDAYYNSDFPERSRGNIIVALSFYGGYGAKRRLIESIPVEPDDIVLDIGPEMGMECFLLTEVYKKVLVAEPEARTCEILQKIASHYTTEKGTKASEILAIKRAGIIPVDSAELVIRPDGRSTGIYAFDGIGAKDIAQVFGKHFANRIFCNHVVQVIPREPKLKILLEGLASYLKPGGKITWADSIPELGNAVGDCCGKPDGKSVSVEEIQDCIRRLLLDFRVSFKVLEKPRQLLVIAERA